MVVSCVFMYGIGFGCGFKYISLWKDLKILGLIKINIFIIIKIIIYYLFTLRIVWASFAGMIRLRPAMGGGMGSWDWGGYLIFENFFFDKIIG